ncbi:MAG: desulfoferrodoxin [Deltaproteobacteria bacterium]
MVEMFQVYKCAVCGNIIEIIHVGGGQLVCCGQPMTLMEENKQDANLEKHVPVVEKKEKGIKVQVGSVLHPMEEKHYIQWIEAIAGDKVQRKFLKPGDKPEAEFEVSAENVKVRELCNLHGLWSN